MVQFCRKVLTVSDDYDGEKFFTTLKDGTKAATPLLLVLAVIEVSDIVFAVDSIPAVFGTSMGRVLKRPNTGHERRKQKCLLTKFSKCM